MTPLSRRTALASTAAGAAGILTPALVPGAASAGPRTIRRTVRARQRFFGARNVHPRTGAVRRDRVVLSWFGCAGFALAIDGEVLLLDAWVPRGMHSGRVPTTPAELAALRPSAVLVGHGHFDHAADAHTVAGASGARVVGTTQHVAQVREKAGDAAIRGLVLGDEADPMGTVRRGRVGRVRLAAVRHPHSAPQPPDLSDPHLPLLPPPDPTSTLLHPPAPTDLCALATGLVGDEEGGCLVYRISVPGFSLVWHDSVGALTEEAPEVRRVLRRMPRPDVHVGAIQGFGQVTNGLRDARHYIEDVAGRVFVPNHHDDWGAPLITGPASGYRGALEAELAKVPAPRRPRLRFLDDPDDYLRPGVLTFRRRPPRG